MFWISYPFPSYVPVKGVGYLQIMGKSSSIGHWMSAVWM